VIKYSNGVRRRAGRVLHLRAQVRLVMNGYARGLLCRANSAHKFVNTRAARAIVRRAASCPASRVDAAHG
jgi:hypothetical protein